MYGHIHNISTLYTSGASGVRLTFFGHSYSKALLKAAVLTAVPRHLIDDAVLFPVARVHHILLDASAEKALLGQGKQIENGGTVHEKKTLTSFRF